MAWFPSAIVRGVVERMFRAWTPAVTMLVGVMSVLGAQPWFLFPLASALGENPCLFPVDAAAAAWYNVSLLGASSMSVGIP